LAERADRVTWVGHNDGHHDVTWLGHDDVEYVPRLADPALVRWAQPDFVRCR
jgi:hypothetical protein